MKDEVTRITRDPRGADHVGRHAILKHNRSEVVIVGYTDRGWIVELADSDQMQPPRLRLEYAGSDLQLLSKPKPVTKDEARWQQECSSSVAA